MIDDRITTELEGLRRQAPDTLLPAVLLETGIIDGHVQLEGSGGPMFVAFNGAGITACRFGNDPAEFEEWFRASFGRPVTAASHLPETLERRLHRALDSGKLGSLPVDLSAVSDFARRVLMKTAQIPPGEVRSYGWVAREIDKPGATRAVGSALNRNPVPVLIPCHRVVPASGMVGNYAFGPEIKRTLLQSEGLDVDEMESAASRGIRFTGSDTTQIYCNPTCHAARRTMDKHQVEFRSADAATTAGYRPCKLCKPKAA